MKILQSHRKGVTWGWNAESALRWEKANVYQLSFLASIVPFDSDTRRSEFMLFIYIKFYFVQCLTTVSAGDIINQIVRRNEHVEGRRWKRGLMTKIHIIQASVRSHE